MFIHTTKKVVESKVAPGVTFSVRKLTERRRAERELSLSPLREKLAKINDAINEAKEKESEDILPLARASNQMSLLLYGEWFPAWINWAISKVDGLEIDGVAAGLDDIKDWPDDLVQEAYKVAENSGLSEEEQKNSLPPGGSDDQADTQIHSSTATTVSDSLSIETAIAQDSSLAT